MPRAGVGVRGGRSPHMVRLGAAVSAFFGVKIVIGVVLVSASAHQLSVEQFVIFSQLFLCLALLSTVSGGAVQGGLTRQIAIAEGDLLAERRAMAGALTIWAGFAALLLATVLVFRSPLSVLLVDDKSLAAALPVVTFTAVLGGAGSILTAALTGRGRVLFSLALQAVGLLVSGFATYWRLRSGDPDGAVLAYATGPVVTAALALLFTRDLLPSRTRQVTALRGELRTLFAYSAAGLAISVVTPATLFGLRHAYRNEFGAELLGYWLAGNRVSDVTSQLLAIYLGQVYLQRMARTAAFAPAQRLASETFLLCSVVMAAGWLVFLAGKTFFVDTFFSSQFRPAIPFISGYLLGDALRVSTSMTSVTAAARGRPWLSVGVEMTIAALISAYVLGLVALGRADAPWLGYVMAQGTMTAFIVIFGKRLLRADLRRRSPPTEPVPVGIQGSESG